MEDAITIPDAFVGEVVGSRGDVARGWLSSLPTLISYYCGTWNLTVDGELAHGHEGLVVPVRCGPDPFVLRAAWPDQAVVDEVVALRHWNGQGAVQLIDAAPEMGIMLLERLDASRTLATEPLEDALRTAARLLRRLATPAPDGLPTLRAYAEELAVTLRRRWEVLGQPFSTRVLHAAERAVLEMGPSSASLLVDWDLHYENVLAGTREPWLIIDPKIISGDPEYGFEPLLWRRLHEDGSAGLARRLALIVDEAELDYERAWGWSVVRCVDYWLWGLGVGLTEDPAACDLIVGWLLEYSA